MQAPVKPGRNLLNDGGVKLHGSRTAAYSAAVKAAGEGSLPSMHTPKMKLVAGSKRQCQCLPLMEQAVGGGCVGSRPTYSS